MWFHIDLNQEISCLAFKREITFLTHSEIDSRVYTSRYGNGFFCLLMLSTCSITRNTTLEYCSCSWTCRTSGLYSCLPVTNILETCTSASAAIWLWSTWFHLRTITSCTFVISGVGDTFLTTIYCLQEVNVNVYINIFTLGFPCSFRWLRFTRISLCCTFITFHREERFKILKYFFKISTGCFLFSSTTSESSPKSITKGIETRTSGKTWACLLLFITIHSCTIIYSSFIFITQCFIGSISIFKKLQVF